MQDNLLKKSKQLREDVDAMKKHLFPDVDCRDRCDRFSRDALMNVMYRANQHVAAQVTSDRDEVLRQVRRSWEARRLARLRRCRKTSQEMDIEDKENVCYSRHFCQSEIATGRKRRRDMLLSSAEMYAVTCFKDPSRLSSNFAKSCEDVPLTSLSSRWSGRCDDSTNASLTRSADRRRVRRPRVPDVVRESCAADNDTSVWSAVSHNDDRRPSSTTERAPVDSVYGGLELSRICSSSPTEQREQTSSGDLTGAFHSTFSYPLHSTLLTAAVTTIDVSPVPETVTSGHELEKTTSGDAPPIGSRSASSTNVVAQDVVDVSRKDCPTYDKRNNFRFNDVAIGAAEHIRTASSQSIGRNVQPLMARLEAGKEDELGGRTSSCMMPYFPPLSTTRDASTSSAVAAAAATNVNMLLEQQDTGRNDDDMRTVLDNNGSRIRHVDTSLEAVRGSPCVISHDPTSGLDVADRLTPSCKRCRVDASTVSRPAARLSHHRREGRCVSANSTSKSGGRGTSRMTRETGRGDLRHTFSAPQDVSSESLAARHVLRVRPSHDRRRTVDNWHCTSTRTYHRQCHYQRRPRPSRCRCGLERQNLFNFVHQRTGGSSRRGVLPPSESGNKTRVKRSERYFDRVRKRTLVNRLKQFSGCFCDTGCGRRMRTLANV